MLSEKQTQCLVNNVNRDVNLPLMSEDHEERVIERVFEKVNPLMEPALRSLCGGPYVDCLKIALKEGIPLEEKQESIKKILRRMLAAPLAEELNKMCDVPFIPERLEGVLFEAIGNKFVEKLTEWTVGEIDEKVNSSLEASHSLPEREEE